MIAGLLYALAVLLAVFVAMLVAAACLAFCRFPGQYFDVDGLRLYYRVEGSGPPVVLIHGYGANADLNWRYPGVIRALRKDYQVIVFDVRGHGRSDKPHDPACYGLETVRDVARLLDHLGISKAHAVGYSMGGFITIKLTEMYPDRLFSAVPCASGWERPEGEKLSLLHSLTESLDRNGGYGPLLRALEPGTPPAWKVALVDFLMGAVNDNKAMSALMKSFPELAVSEEALRNNRVPTLSIVGDRDPLGAGVKPMAAVMANHEAVYIPGGDHMTTIVKQAYMTNLKDFLAKHSPSPR